ncbi:MAG TPA: DUF4271 domain-containing protein [Flavitalea sp.]|nr:DUF4271 domain-containing protein [Flavitalea sp.]
MRTFYLIIFFLIATGNIAFSQSAKDSIHVISADSVGLRDSIPLPIDSLPVEPVVRINQDSINAVRSRIVIDRIQKVLAANQFYRFLNPPIRLHIEERSVHSDEYIFYFLIGLLLFYALIRMIFFKYLNNLLSLFFRVTMRQQQIREQVLQTPLPSLLLNLLFVISSGLYLTLIAHYLGVSPSINEWVLLAYSIAFISVIYAGKFVFLKFTGWVFNVSNATDTYIFIVFLVNKMIGMFLLPFLLVMAFPSSPLYPVAVVISLVLIILLFLYRFFISYRPIRNEIKVGKFHFFLYLCAFEIAPLLLIYKVLLNFVEHGA